MKLLSLRAIPTVKQPAAVAKLDAAHTKLVLELEDARQQLRAAERAELPAAEQADFDEEVAAAAAGKTVTDPGARAREIRTKIATLARRVDVLTTASNKAAVRLAEAFLNSSGGWCDQLLQEEQAAAEDLAAVVRDVLRPALKRLTEARGAVAYLARAVEMDAHRLASGGAGPIAPPLKITDPVSDRNSKPVATALVDALLELAQPQEPEPKPAVPRLPGNLPPMLPGRVASRVSSRS